MSRRTARSLLILGALPLALLACGQDKEAATAPAAADTPLPEGLAQAAQQAKAVADKAAALSDTESPALTPEQYEQLLLGLAACTVTAEGHIEHACEALKAFDKARNAKTALKDLAGMTGGLGKKHLRHESPAVRVKSAQLMGSLFGADSGTQQLILDAIAAEQEPAVIRALIEVVGSKGKANPAIGAMLVKLADHASPVIRKAAIGWLASSWNKGVPGGVEKLSAKIEKDADPAIRQFACEYAGKLGDDKLIKLYDKHTKSAKDARMYTACMRGLLQMWLSYPFFENASKPAYELTLKRLSAKPRSADVPPWGLMGEFKYLGKDDDKIRAWKAKAPWYKQDKLLAAITQVVEDPKANWMARTGAIESLLGLGASKATFASLLKKCGAGCDSNVKRRLEEAQTKAP